MMQPTCSPLKNVVFTALAGCLLVAATTVRADEIKLSGFWIKDVTIRGIGDGAVNYISPTGAAVRAPLEKLEGLKLDAYPGLTAAFAAIDAGDKTAVNQLRAARRKVREPWLKTHIDGLIVKGLAAAGKDGEALKAYVALAEGGADPYYLLSPPLGGAVDLDDAGRRRIKARVEGLREKANSVAFEEALDRLLAMLGGGGTTGPEAAVPGPGAGEVDPVDPGLAAPGADAAAAVVGEGLLLPGDAPPDSAVVQLLKRGRYSEALQASEAEVRKTTGLSSALFFKGLAQLGIAEADEHAPDDTRRKQYLDAGLSFMRVVVYYPRSRYAALATLEAGYVHQAIGDLVAARRLYTEAGGGINPDLHPAYHQRWQQLTAGAAKEDAGNVEDVETP